MKDLTIEIEEKAKRYDEALERAKYWAEGKCVEDFDDSPQNVLNFVFPETKESEDEKIRKWIRRELESKYVVDNIVNNEMADKAFAWLEKQGEQKMKTEPKDVIDVPLIDIPFGAKDSELIGATYFIPKGFHAEIEDDKVIFKKGEQKPAWSEEDERIRGAICDTLDRIDEHIMKCHQRLTHQQVKDWLKSLKERIKK